MAGAFASFVASLTPEARAFLPIKLRGELAKRAAAAGDVLEWGKAVMPDKFSLPYCSLHRYLVSSRHKRLFAVKAPRWHSKTTIDCTLIPLYQALEEPHKPFSVNLVIEANDEKALALNRAAKHELEHNAVLRYVYGDQSSARWTDAEFVTRSGVAFKASAAGASTRGIQYNNRRPDRVRIDDLYNEEDIHNLEMTRKKTEWFKSTVYNLLAQDHVSSLGVLGTAINAEDVLTVMEKWEGCEHKTFKALQDDGTALWPELYDEKKLEQMRKHIGPVIFNREMQSTISDDTEAVIRGAWLDGWEKDPADVRVDRDNEVVDVLVLCDPSIGKNSTNDPTGFALMWKLQRSDGSLPWYFITALRNDRLSLQQRLDHVRDWVASSQHAHPVRNIRVETISGFKDFGDLVQSQIPVPCTMVDRVPDKLTNLEKKSYFFQNHRVFISTRIPQALREELRLQLTTNYPTHDDLRDAVLLGLGDGDGLWRHV